VEKTEGSILERIAELRRNLSEKLPLEKVGELRKAIGEKINIPPEIKEKISELKDKIIPKKEGDNDSNLIKDYAPRVSELSAKISEKYTPTKGLILVLCFLSIDMILQLYTITKVSTFEIVEKSIRIDFVTIVSFVSYTLTMISILFILSEFFLMRRMEALFSIDEIKSIGNGQVDQFLESADEDDSDNIEMPSPVLEDEKPDLNSIFDIPPEKEETEAVDPFAAMEATPEEESDKRNEVLEEKNPVGDLWDFDITPAPVEPVEPEEEEEEAIPDMSQSEILATLSELREVVAELKLRTRK